MQSINEIKREIIVKIERNTFKKRFNSRHYIVNFLELTNSNINKSTNIIYFIKNKIEK